MQRLVSIERGTSRRLSPRNAPGGERQEDLKPAYERKNSGLAPNHHNLMGGLCEFLSELASASLNAEALFFLEFPTWHAV